jgi:DNA-binding IclR family transcriptional regulator
MTKSKNSYIVPAVDRAIDVLEYMVERNQPVIIQEVADYFSIPKASVFRLFRTLEARGYLVNTDDNNRYILGPRVLLLGSRITKEQNLRQIASAHMFTLANDTKQTVQLGVLFGYKALYIDQVRTTTVTDILIEPTGTPFEVNVSAGGKVMVANLPDRDQDDFLGHAELARNTERSITDKSSFRQELEQVRLRGYGTDEQEFAVGIRCVAAPVFDGAGRCVASIGITGHISKMTTEAMPALIERTKRAGREISVALGFPLSGQE